MKHFLAALCVVLLSGCFGKSDNNLDSSKKETEQSSNLNRELFFDSMSSFKSPVVGNTQGKVILVEFFDYNCPHCRHFHETVQKAIKQNGNLRVVLRPVPFMGKDSEMVTPIALAAQGQGKFEKMHNAFMSSKVRLTEQVAYNIARDLGMDVSALKAKAHSAEVADLIGKNVALSRALGVRGVPFTVVGNAGNKELSGLRGAVPFADVQKEIEKQ